MHKGRLQGQLSKASRSGITTKASGSGITILSCEASLCLGTRGYPGYTCTRDTCDRAALEVVRVLVYPVLTPGSALHSS
eukprot:3303335-Rhodomonas_salina.2